MQALFDRSILDPLCFYVFGTGISFSLTPAMHGAAYEISGLRYDFHRQETSSVKEVLDMTKDPHFGGASISRPFKVSIFENLAVKSVHAEAIGAFNTLLPLRAASDGKLLPIQDQVAHRGQAAPITVLYGDNTDWIGISTCIVRNLSPRNVIQPGEMSGLVIGAGGMARAAIYALIKLGCRKAMIYNRTVAKAERVADHFNTWLLREGVSRPEIGVLRSSVVSWPTNFNLPTIVISCIYAYSHDNGFKFPLQWLASPTGGLVLEMAYKPLTPFLDIIRPLREKTAQVWVIIDGLEILPEQGIAQFELMTGKKAPRGQMRREVERSYQMEGNGSKNV